MREKWARHTALQPINKPELQALIQKFISRAAVQHAEYAEGGLANTNIKVHLADGKLVHVRFFVRDGSQALKEFNTYRLVSGSVPTPAVIGFCQTSELPGESPFPCLLLEWVEGVRLEQVLRDVSADEAQELGVSVGRSLAAIHRHTFPAAGFLSPELEVVEEVQLGSGGLKQYAATTLDNPIVRERLGDALSRQIAAFIEAECGLLDRESFGAAASLTHADFGGSNILVRQVKGRWSVAAVIDWEFCFAGNASFDLGNLLRRRLNLPDVFESAVAQGYRADGGYLPPEWRRISLLNDLTAWFDFLTREAPGEQLIEDARAVLHDTMSVWGGSAKISS